MDINLNGSQFVILLYLCLIGLPSLISLCKIQNIFCSKMRLGRLISINILFIYLISFNFLVERLLFTV